MLDTYFGAGCTLSRIRSGPLGGHLDSFRDYLESRGYCRAVVQGYVNPNEATSPSMSSSIGDPYSLNL